MKARRSLGLGRTAEARECGFGEEVRVMEPLSLLPSFCAKHALDAEYSRICRNPIDGIYVVPSAKDVHCWYGVIFLRAGVFSGGIFRFTINIQKDYPQTTSLPEIIFDISICHPHINADSRVLELTRYFPDGWKKDKHHIQYALLVAQRIFFSLDADYETCANPEAAKLWRDNRQKFKEIAKECVNESRSHVYDDPTNEDPNTIRFTPWDSSVHDKTRLRMKSVFLSKAVHCGISWFDIDRLVVLNESTGMSEPFQRLTDTSPINNSRRRSVPNIERLDLSGISDSITSNSMDSSRAPYYPEDIEISDV